MSAERMTDTISGRLRRLADDLDLYSGLSTADDLRRAVGVEIAMLGAEIMADGRREEIAAFTVTLPKDLIPPDGATYTVAEQPPRRRLLQRVRTWLR